MISVENRSRVVLALLAISAVISFIDRGNLSVASPVLALEFKLNSVQLGVLLSAFFWTYAGFQIVAGLLVDRNGAGLIYGLGFLLWTVATLLTGFASGFGSLLVLRLL